MMTIFVAKIKALISCTVTAADLRLFSHMQKSRFSHDEAQIISEMQSPKTGLLMVQNHQVYSYIACQLRTNTQRNDVISTHRRHA